MEEKAQKKAIQEGCTIQEIKDRWNNISSLAKELGKHLHNQIENYFQDRSVEMSYIYSFRSYSINIQNKRYDISKEFSFFEKLYNEVDFRSQKPYRTAWHIYSIKYKIVGTVDLVYKESDNSYIMCDWIRTNKLFDEEIGFIPSHNYGKGIYGMEKMTNNEYNIYCMKQNIHKYILEEEYGLNISKMYLLILHPDYSKYRTIYIPNRQCEAEYMLQNKHLVIKEI